MSDQQTYYDHNTINPPSPELWCEAAPAGEWHGFAPHEREQDDQPATVRMPQDTTGGKRGSETTLESVKDYVIGHVREDGT